jgi:HEAT repeat protein
MHLTGNSSMRSAFVAISFAAALFAAGCNAKPPVESLAHGQPLAHWLQELQSAPDSKARKHAARILGNIGPAYPDVVPALAAALKDKAVEVRQEAIAALEKIGPAAKDALPALEAAQKDPDAKVRALAAAAIKRIRESP